VTYQRVIPRDLFNEASLLKCYGALYIAMETAGTRAARFSQEDVEHFDIEQRDEDGSIYVANLTLIAGAARYLLTRPLNSRRPWPLYAERIDDRDFEPVPVFDDDGNLTEEMENLL
jgi:hypothetical protein